MSSKKKMIVWHKKKGAFIAPGLIKGHGGAADTGRQDHRKNFAEDLAAKIKDAARRSTGSLT